MEQKEKYPKCSAGCISYYGGEKRHTPGCYYYPESMTKMFDSAREEITILREQLRGTREELAEARKQREEAMEQMGVLRGRIKTIGRSLEENHKQAQALFEADQKSMKALFDENTRLKEYIKKSCPFLND